MKEGVTKTGFHFSLEDDAMDDMELVEELANMQENDLIAITRVVTMVFGPDQKKALYDHLRTQEGRVKVSTVMDAIKDAFAVFGEQGKTPSPRRHDFPRSYSPYLRSCGNLRTSELGGRAGCHTGNAGRRLEGKFQN